MAVGLATYILTVIALVAVILLVVVFLRKPSQNGTDFEMSTLELIEEIKSTAEIYISRLEKEKAEIDGKIKENKKRQEIVEDYYRKVIDERAGKNNEHHPSPALHSSVLVDVESSLDHATKAIIEKNKEKVLHLYQNGCTIGEIGEYVNVKPEILKLILQQHLKRI